MSSLYQMPTLPELHVNLQPNQPAKITAPAGILLPELAHFRYDGMLFEKVPNHEFVILRDSAFTNPWDHALSIVNSPSLQEARATSVYPSAEILGNVHYGFVPFLLEIYREPASIAGHNDLGWLLRAPGYEGTPMNESLLQIFAEDSRVGALMGSGHVSGVNTTTRPMVILVSLELVGDDPNAVLHGLAWHAVNMFTAP